MPDGDGLIKPWAAVGSAVMDKSDLSKFRIDEIGDGILMENH